VLDPTGKTRNLASQGTTSTFPHLLPLFPTIPSRWVGRKEEAHGNARRCARLALTFVDSIP
jgi:hypothetical protein